MSPQHLLSVVLAWAAFAALAELLFRRAARRFHERQDLPAEDRYRTSVRALSPLGWMSLPALFTCFYLGTIEGSAIASVSTALASAGVIALVASVAFLRLWVRASGKPITGPTMAAVVVRSAAVQVAMVVMMATGLPGAVWILTRFAPRLSSTMEVALLVGTSIFGIAAAFVTIPFVIRALHRGRRIDDPRLLAALSPIEDASGLRIRDVYCIESPAGMANAIVAGILPGAQFVFVNDVLRQHLPVDEIAAIVAHEMAHIHHRHLRLSFLRSIPTLLAYLVLIQGIRSFAQWLGAADGPVLAAGAAAASWVILAVVFHLPLTRAAEHEADRTAAGWVGRDLYVRALRHVYSLNLAGTGATRVEGWTSTHPDLQARIAKIEVA